MWYFLLALVLVLVTVMLFIRFRVRLVLNEGESLFFAGYGRTGYEYNFTTDIETLKLCGFTITQLKKTKQQPKRERSAISTYRTGYRTLKNRGQEIRQLAAIVPKSGKAVLRFGWTILKRLTLEECRAHITAGFDSPDQTGRVLGWYYSIVGAVPSLRERLFFTPVWDRATLDASGRLTISIPLYKIIGPLARLIHDIPWKQIIRLTKQNQKRSPIWKTT